MSFIDSSTSLVLTVINQRRALQLNLLEWTLMDFHNSFHLCNFICSVRHSFHDKSNWNSATLRAKDKAGCTDFSWAGIAVGNAPHRLKSHKATGSPGTSRHSAEPSSCSAPVLWQGTQIGRNLCQGCKIRYLAVYPQNIVQEEHQLHFNFNNDAIFFFLEYCTSNEHWFRWLKIFTAVSFKHAIHCGALRTTIKILPNKAVWSTSKILGVNEYRHWDSERTGRGP